MRRDFFLVVVLLFIMNFGTSLSASLGTVYLLSKNFSYLQINALDTLCLLSSILMELPTGIIGDRFGHKVSFLVSILLRSLRAVLFPLVMNFYPMCILFIIEAVASACESGSYSVWINDSFSDGCSEKSYLRLNSTINIVASIAGIASGFTGSLIADISMNYCYYFKAICYLISFIGLVFIGTNTTDKKNCDESNNIVEIVKSITKDFLLKPGLWILPLIASNLFLFTISGIDNYWQPLMMEHSEKQVYSILGFTWVFISLTNLGAGLFTRFVSSRVNSKYILFIFPLISACVFLILVKSSVSWVLASLIFCLNVLSCNCYFPIINAKFYNALPEGIKASALSFSSVVESLVSCIGLLVFGYIGNSDIHNVFITGGIVMILTSVFILIAQQFAIWNKS